MNTYCTWYTFVTVEEIPIVTILIVTNTIQTISETVEIGGEASVNKELKLTCVETKQTISKM